MQKLGLILTLLSLVSCASTRKNFERAQSRQPNSYGHIALGSLQLKGP